MTGAEHLGSLQANASVPEGKRRIRVHTMCLPVVNQLSDVYAGADVQAITCLLANMGEASVSALKENFLPSRATETHRNNEHKQVGPLLNTVAEPSHLLL